MHTFIQKLKRKCYTDTMQSSKKRGFTIVELLVVIVIIAIIASILYFILSGWRVETARTEVQNDLKNLTTEIQQYRNFNNTYPATLANLQYDNTSSVSISYTLRGDGTYCINASSIPEPAVQYNVDSAVSANAVEGTCS